MNLNNEAFKNFTWATTKYFIEGSGKDLLSQESFMLQKIVVEKKKFISFTAKVGGDLQFIEFA